MKLHKKIFFTLSMIIMSPMLRDDPKSTEKSASKMFWKTLKDLWANKLDKDFE